MSGPSFNDASKAAVPASSNPGEPVLAIDGLHVDFPSEDGRVTAVRDLALDLRRGEVLGIVGESGSGKSTLAAAILGLQPAAAQISGSIRIAGNDILAMNDRQLSALRGNHIGLVVQDSAHSLTPVHPIGQQLVEAIRAHSPLSKAQAKQRAIELLKIVEIADPHRRFASFPHELSAGMRQRVVIAMAMSNDPGIIIADEPTTALDVTVQAQILDALAAARGRTGASMLLITHDLGVIARYADRVAVMYAGSLVEVAPVGELFKNPSMPYTIGLLAGLPRIDDTSAPPMPIPGQPPSALDLPAGCAFWPRCPIAEPHCATTRPALALIDDQHHAACHYPDRVAEIGAPTLYRRTPASGHSERGAADSAVVLETQHLVKLFPVRGSGSRDRVVAQKGRNLHAVDDVSIKLHQGRTLGLVGESGSGKSTLARLILNLIPATSGRVLYEGRDLQALSQRAMRPVRRHLQVVFQDPAAALDPRMSIARSLAEPRQIHQLSGRDVREPGELLELVGLRPEHAQRYPHEFSSGQRQRIVLARSLALNPKVLLLDEPLSSLDVSIEAEMVNLLRELQHELDLTLLLISHNLATVRAMADEVAVMQLGQIVESGPTETVFDEASHPYTQALISAIPVPDPAREKVRERIMVIGEPASAVDPSPGCRFRARCPLYASSLSDRERDRCVESAPELADRGWGHPAACHFGAPLGHDPGSS